MITRDVVQRTTYAAVGAFVDELVRSGVRHFCVCPGSRSTPLALMIAQHPQAQLWMHIDERSAAFFGLGMAKLLREPVALVCTSGTAAANFLPAVVEAFYARVPLIVLTADRPHELRDCGAPQTIDQVHLFGAHVKWFVDLAEPDAAPDMLRYTRVVACRAAAMAQQAPAGPVHINCPYREPLIPQPGDELPAWMLPPYQHAYVTAPEGLRAPQAGLVAALAADLAAARSGLILCGPQDDPQLATALVGLAAMLGYPVLADPLSGLRCGTHDRAQVISSYDAFLRDDEIAARLAPDVVLRFGASPVSKALQLYFQRHRDHRHILVDGGAGWNDPALLASDVLPIDGRLLCDALTAALSGSRALNPAQAAWLDEWIVTDRLAREAIAERIDTLDELFEGKVFAELSHLLPDGAVLYAGNSMPIRDLDSFFAGSEQPIRLLANRGANGIDGVVSSALGASAAGARPLLLVIGDLSFYHDSNGLLAARQHDLNATIILMNNDGGGIFSFLPQVAEREHFERLFGTPHGLDFRSLAHFYGATFAHVTSWDDFRSAVCEALDAPGLKIVEVVTERERNVTLHREMWRTVSEALHRESAVGAA